MADVPFDTKRKRKDIPVGARYGIAAIVLAIALVSGLRLALVAPDVPIESSEEQPESAVSIEDDAAGIEQTLFVHVGGAVNAPGVYELPVGSRVFDAVEEAGGATDDARTEAVNLAREVHDGEQIIVPSAAAMGMQGTDGAASGSEGATSGAPFVGMRININTASADELQTLNGIGERIAQRIIAYREANGPFDSIDDLTAVSGIGRKKLEAIADAICI